MVSLPKEDGGGGVFTENCSFITLVHNATEVDDGGVEGGWSEGKGLPVGPGWVRELQGRLGIIKTSLKYLATEN